MDKHINFWTDMLHAIEYAQFTDNIRYFRRAPRFLPDRNIKFINTVLTWCNVIKKLGVIINKKLTYFKNTVNSQTKEHKPAS